jgi:hypothetical protein
MKMPRRRRGAFFNFLLVIAVIGAVALFAWAEQKRRDAIRQLEQTTQELAQIRESTQRSGQEVAQEVLGKVRKHMDVPTDPEPTVATIIDVERLRESNEFYKKAENGDHLVITDTRAILYDPDKDLVIDVVPVRIDRTASPAPSGTPAVSGTPTAIPPANNPFAPGSPAPASPAPAAPRP